MYLEDLSFLLFGGSIATFIRNMWDYYLNTKAPNYDNIGAMINWHYGFLISWILFCTGISFYPENRWFYGLILFPFVILATFLLWYPLHWILKNIKTIK